MISTTEGQESTSLVEYSTVYGFLISRSIEHICHLRTSAPLFYWAMSESFGYFCARLFSESTDLAATDALITKENTRVEHISGLHEAF